MTVDNTGETQMLATVTDTIPAGMTYVTGSAMTANGDVSGFPPTWSLNVAAMTSAVLTFDTEVTGSPNSTPYVNNVTLDATDSFGGTFQDSDTAEVDYNTNSAISISK